MEGDKDRAKGLVQSLHKYIYMIFYTLFVAGELPYIRLCTIKMFGYSWPPKQNESKRGQACVLSACLLLFRAMHVQSKPYPLATQLCSH